MFELLKDFAVAAWDEEPELLLLFAFILFMVGALRWASRRKRRD
jgi:hypothetical protein